MTRRALFLVGLLAACTSQRPAGPGPERSGPPPIALPVVTSVTGPTSELDATFVDGMRLAVERVNGSGGVDGRLLELEVHDDAGHPGQAREELNAVVANGTPMLVVGPGATVSRLRTRIEEFGDPVILLGGDLYTPHLLFHEVFQTSVPVVWQARVVARYLAVDRRDDDIVAVGRGRQNAVLSAALQEEHRNLSGVTGAIDGGARRADAVLLFGGPGPAAATDLAGVQGAPQLALPVEGLGSGIDLPPGTVAPYAYTWAGWADPIRRVHRFRAAFQERFGRLPLGFEQEGYDAVRLLALGLRHTDARSGEGLIRFLEHVKDRPFSSLPIRLTPDDHTFIGEVQLGLFAVPGPDERVEPWVDPEAPWRPIMRTFTFDGKKTNVLDIDKRVFFPRWHKPLPSPYYWKSRYGITTRYGRDPLH